MTRTKAVDTKVYRNGNSQSLTLHKSIMDELGIEIGETLSCYVEDGKIIFEKKERSFEDEWNEFFDNGGSYQQYREEEIDWEKPVGRET